MPASSVSLADLTTRSTGDTSLAAKSRMPQRVMGESLGVNIVSRSTPFILKFVSRFHLPLRIILAIMYSWIHKLRVGQVLELLAGEITSNNTDTDWFNFCRDVCSHYLLTHPVILGGMGD